jgi:hypothetical protein
MARLRSRWHNSKTPKSIETIAGAMAMNVWKLAFDTANRMYSTGFNFKDNSQLLDLIGEFVVFEIQLADRIAYETLDDEQRQRFTIALAKHLIGTMVENQTQELGPDEHYAQRFMDKLNQRLEGYQEFTLVDGSPSYPMLRYFGTLCEEVIGGQDNKWVIEHVMEVEAPPMIRQLRNGLEKLLPQAMPEPGDKEG